MAQAINIVTRSRAVYHPLGYILSKFVLPIRFNGYSRVTRSNSGLVEKPAKRAIPAPKATVFFVKP
jgi:hypothetical protein